jgi:hypothetical protein
LNLPFLQILHYADYPSLFLEVNRFPF